MQSVTQPFTPADGLPQAHPEIHLIDIGAGSTLPEPWRRHAALIRTWVRLHASNTGDVPASVTKITHESLLWESNEERNWFIYRGRKQPETSHLLYDYDYVLNHYTTLKRLGSEPLAKTWFESALPTDVVRRHCRQLDDVLQELNLDEAPCFLKISAQGAEYAILKGASNCLRQACLGLQLRLYDFPLYKDSWLVEQMTAWLNAQGFQLIQISPRYGPFDALREGLFLKKEAGSGDLNRVRQVYGLPEIQAAAPSLTATAAEPGGKTPPVLSLHQVLIRSRRMLSEFHNIHPKQRCVIIGNGPSLNQMDLRFLSSEYTFGMNRIFLGFDRWRFQPNWYVAVNTLVIEQNARRIEQLTMPKFLREEHGLRYLHDFNRTILLHPVYHGQKYFSKNLLQGYYEGYTVTYVAMQLAYFMGFSEVVLIGVDHNFVTQGPANQEVLAQDADPNHFHPDYFGPGMKWHLPDLKESEISYHLAKTAFESDGRQILDATVGGKLTIFPKVDYRKLFYPPGELSPPEHQTAAQLNRKGEALFQQGRAEDAIRLFEQAIALDATLAAGHNNLGVAWFLLGKPDQAAQHLRRAMDLDPQNLEIQENLARCRSHTG